MSEAEAPPTPAEKALWARAEGWLVRLQEALARTPPEVRAILDRHVATIGRVSGFQIDLDSAAVLALDGEDQKLLRLIADLLYDAYGEPGRPPEWRPQALGPIPKREHEANARRILKKLGMKSRREPL